MTFWATANKVLGEADIILLILDARMPGLSMNREIKDKVEGMGKKIVYVYNKIDLISKEQLDFLRQNNPDAFFVSGIGNVGISKLKISLQIIGKRIGRENPKVGLVGYPNVGKSAIINAMAKRARAAVSSVAGTTKGIQWIKAGGLSVLDSPGVIPFEDRNMKLGILGAKNPEKLKNPIKVAYEIIDMFLNENRKGFEEHYKIKFSEDKDEVLLEIGKKKGYLMRGGIVDEKKTALSIIHDWQKGKLRLG